MADNIVVDIAPATNDTVLQPPDWNSEKRNTDAHLQEKSIPAMVGGPRFWMIIVSLMVATFLSALDLTSLSTALPTIVGHLHGSSNFVWVGSAFALGSTAFLPLSGGLAQIFGRRPIILGSLTLFLFGSGISGGAKDMNMLIAGRTVQGVGSGGIMSLTEIIIADLVPLRQRGTYVGLTGAVWAIASAIGPPIGGAFSQSNWRWLFYLNLPLSAIAMVIVFAFLRVKVPQDDFRTKMRKMDWTGNFIVVASTAASVIALTWAGIKYPWNSYQTLVPLVLGLLGLGGFFVYEGKFAQEPVVPLELFNNRTGLVGVAYFNLYRPQNYIGWILTTLGMGLLSLLSSTSPKATWILFQMIEGIGIGILFSALQFPILASIDVSQNAHALALLVFLQSYSHVWAVVVGASVLQNELKRNLPEAFLGGVLGGVGGGVEIAYAAIPAIRALEEPLKGQVREAYAESVKVVWWVMTGLSGLGLLVALFMKELRLREVTDENWGLVDARKPDVGRIDPSATVPA
ncbi:hypothetical protein FRB99_006730 [Tulasnella sp. 403]|nr:hypothetical protein FRB99_006730 [Tulasnella sp. 403]